MEFSLHHISVTLLIPLEGGKLMRAGKPPSIAKHPDSIGREVWRVISKICRTPFHYLYEQPPF